MSAVVCMELVQVPNSPRPSIASTFLKAHHSKFKSDATVGSDHIDISIYVSSPIIHKI